MKLAMTDEEIKKVNGGRKFDVCLSNPPYSGSLHLKFLEKMIGLAEKVVSIQPITWLQNVFGDKVGKKQINKYKVTDVEFVGKLANVFSMTNKATYDVGIIYCDNNAKINTDLQYQFIELYPGQKIEPELIKSIKDKISGYCVEHNLEANIHSGKIGNDTKYCIVMPKLIGNVGEKTDRYFWKHSPRWGRVFYKGQSEGKSASEYKKRLKNVTNYDEFDYIEFDSMLEASNWIDSQDTDFMRFITILNCVDSHRRAHFIPFMDYKESWDNDKLCGFFNITDEEKAKMHKYIKLFEKNVKSYDN